MTAEYDAVQFFARFLYNEESKHLLLERQLSFVILIPPCIIKS